MRAASTSSPTGSGDGQPFPDERDGWRHSPAQPEHQIIPLPYAVSSVGECRSDSVFLVKPMLEGGFSAFGA